MKKLLSFACVCAIAASLTGCAYMGGQTDLEAVANNANLSNVTTGDGTFEDYTATGYHTGTEIGIAVGLPFLVKFMELYPARTNTDLLTDVAKDAQGHGADAMINVHPAQENYMGFPFGIIGLYVDQASGTGIQMK